MTRMIKIQTQLENWKPQKYLSTMPQYLLFFTEACFVIQTLDGTKKRNSDVDALLGIIVVVNSWQVRPRTTVQNTCDQG